MAIPTFVAAGTVQSGTGGVTPGLPAGYAADDIFLLFCETADQTVSTPSGWTIAPDSPISNGLGSQLSVFYRRATASESAPAIADPGDHLIARILAFRGCIASGSPFDVSRNDIPSGTSWSMQMPTTTVADTLLVMGIACSADTTSAQFSGWTNAALTSVTEQVDNFTTSGNGGGFAVATGGKATAGSIGNTTGSCSTNDDFEAWIGALKPVANTTYNQSVLATTTPASTTVRSTSKPTRATSTPLAVLTRSAGKLVRATTQPVASLTATRVTLVALQAASTLVAGLLRQVGKLTLSTTTPAANLRRDSTKTLASTTTPAATTTRSTSKGLAVSTTPIGGLTKRSDVALRTAVSVEGRAQRSVARALMATVTPIASLTSGSVFSVALQASAVVRASFTRLIRLFWTPQQPTSETWVTQTVTDETWVTQAPTAETWTPQTPTSETWVIQTPTPETWT